jgi:hypothetical protein
VRLAGSPLCADQSFVKGPHLGMQFHIEMDPPTIAVWCASGAGEVAEALAGPRPQGVQDAATVQALTAERLPRMRAVTARVCQTHWADALQR